jgi:hypothetical protein
MREERRERKKLKQQLFTIRRWFEGENVVLTDELLAIKRRYENLPEFSNWSGFPERWDIGDPFGIKKGGSFLNEIDLRNANKIAGKNYASIIHLDQQESRD